MEKENLIAKTKIITFTAIKWFTIFQFMMIFIGIQLYATGLLFNYLTLGEYVVWTLCWILSCSLAGIIPVMLCDYFVNKTEFKDETKH